MTTATARPTMSRFDKLAYLQRLLTVARWFGEARDKFPENSERDTACAALSLRAYREFNTLTGLHPASVDEHELSTVTPSERIVKCLRDKEWTR